MITNEEFGKLVGCHHSMSSRLRAGKRVPGRKLEARICEEFGIPEAEMRRAVLGGGEAVAALLRRRVFDPTDDSATAKRS